MGKYRYIVLGRGQARQLLRDDEVLGFDITVGGSAVWTAESRSGTRASRTLCLAPEDPKVRTYHVQGFRLYGMPIGELPFAGAHDARLCEEDLESLRREGWTDAAISAALEHGRQLPPATDE